jgi:hypothetical protein
VRTDRTECEEKRTGPCSPKKRYRLWRASRSTRRLASEAGFLIFVCTTVFGQPRSDTNKTQPKVTIYIYNYAKVPQNLLRAAKENVTRTLLEAGVKTVWRDCALERRSSPNTSGSSGLSDSVKLVIKILPASMTQQMPSGRTSLGFAALSTEMRRGSDAFVFFDRVQEVAEIRYVNEAWLLASVMAHEFGHLLLGPGHSGGGIMSGFIDGEGNMLRIARFGVLEFMPAQAELVRAEVLKRMAQEHVPSNTKGPVEHASAREPRVPNTRELCD